MRITILPSVSYALARRFVGLFALCLSTLVLATGCDSTGGLDDSDEASVSAEETAESIAFSLAENTGGTTDDLASGVVLFSEAPSGPGGAASGDVLAKDVTRDRSCTYSDADQAWTCTLTVSGSRPRVDTLGFTRSFRVQFFDGDTPVRTSSSADSMTYALSSGTGTVQSERIDNTHELSPATWSFAKTGTAGEFTVRLLDGPAGRDVDETFTGPRRERTRTAQIRKTRVDDLVWRRGTPGRPVSGVMEGTYDADVEVQRPNGDTATRTVSVSYVATFSEDGAEITLQGGGERFDGETFSFDVTTGQVQ